MRDTRKSAQKYLGKLDPHSKGIVRKIIGSLLFASVAAALPEYAGLSEAGRWCLFILLLAGGLWVTEAIPAFAVSLLVIGLEIMVLGRPGGVLAETKSDWTMFVEPWSSPVIWLFFGGFVLASAAAKSGLDRQVCAMVIRRCQSKPSLVLLGVMGVTFVFSMFVSNTATTAMMMAVVTPVIIALPKDQKFARALLLGVPVAANLGGMGTVIGSPPNAIAVGILQDKDPVSFLQWMAIGLPPALVLAGVGFVYLLVRYPAGNTKLDLSSALSPSIGEEPAPRWQQTVVFVVFMVTVGLWMSGPLHGVPTPVVSFVPITAFTVTGVLGAFDMRKLPWDVLLLMTGGLSLGVGVSETGLADWLLQQLPVDAVSPFVLAGAFAFGCMALSNFMSNTAATNIIVPVAAAIGTGFDLKIIAPIALAASTAMCLPVSTPPNAIAYSSGRLEAKDFVAVGIIMGILGAALATGWCALVLD
ncbi:SLC13 family permease [Synoicihabitans lomoniglobus]|uniref:DASS family sodium-coupled anion symporter n=1 Tax=Synoicihabitans lomoniglobus TaxID=2909285 RepID=A0AAF0CNU0_9BACT|nr:DASS family sodium-coupled anion symporter [Opitutaceae bacterium LMO-M01]WED64835.1 DASS family sodium-coupled anion symporter [Opitutaceae bacterium LMO-M01]